MVTTRRQEQNQQQRLQLMPEHDEMLLGEQGTPDCVVLPATGRIKLKSALKTQRRLDPQYGGGTEPGGDGEPGRDCKVPGLAAKRRVRINSHEDVRIFQRSATTDAQDGGGGGGDSGATSPRRRRRPALRPALCALPAGVPAALVLAAWSVVSSVLVLYIKAVMVDRGLSFPLFLPAISQLGCGALAWGAGALGAAPVRPLPPPRDVAARLLPLAAATSLCLFLGNYAQLRLSVAFLNILKAFTPAVTLSISAAFGMERLTPVAALSTVVIAVGTGMATVAETTGNAEFHWPSLAAFVASVVFEGLRVVLTARLLGGMAQPYNPVELLAHLGPIVFVLMAAASLAAEGPALRAAAAAELGPVFLWISLLSFLINLTSYYAIRLTSSTTFKVTGSLKNAAVVWRGVAGGDRVTALQLRGFALSIAGFLLFTLTRGGSGAAPRRRARPAGAGKRA